MTPVMSRQKFSMKALEVFLAVSRNGALKDASDDLGISVSTASHHLSEIEKAAGLALFDHGRRPMRLTPAGEVLRRRVDEAMGSLRKGFSEVWADDPAALVRVLRIALIEDFDADVGPALAEELIGSLPQCDFSYVSRPTHDIHELLASEQLDIGVATTTDMATDGIAETPLLRDPFILLLPASSSATPATPPDLMAHGEDLPFLRYSSRQMLGRRIEAQLRRMDLRFPRRMEFETTHIILSLVAAGRGWTVTTALSFARAQRYHSGLRVLPFPGRAFSRDISVFAREDVPQAVEEICVTTIRRAIRRLVLDPTLARYPWLSNQFRLIEAEAVTARSGTAP